jgi:hypothetical protein
MRRYTAAIGGTHGVGRGACGSRAVIARTKWCVTRLFDT